MTFKFKYFAAMAVLVFSSIALVAQTEGDDVRPEFKERGKQKANQMAEKLGLNEDEAVEFKAIQKKYSQQIKEAKANVTSKEEMAEIRYANHKAKIAEVKALLTPEQYAIFDKVEPRKGRKGKKGRKGGKEKRKL